MEVRKIEKIYLHCSDSPDSRDIGVDEIDRWHEMKGWKSPSGIHCGYHYVVLRSGDIERGRPDEEVGAHVKDHNKNSLGVVWVGRENRSDEQIITLYFLLDELLTKYGLEVSDVLGHYESNEYKTCPNFEMDLFRKSFEFFRAELSRRQDGVSTTHHRVC